MKAIGDECVTPGVAFFFKQSRAVKVLPPACDATPVQRLAAAIDAGRGVEDRRASDFLRRPSRRDQRPRPTPPHRLRRFARRGLRELHRTPFGVARGPIRSGVSGLDEGARS